MTTRWITLSQAAELLGCTPDEARWLLNNAGIKTDQMDHGWHSWFGEIVWDARAVEELARMRESDGQT